MLLMFKQTLKGNTPWHESDGFASSFKMLKCNISQYMFDVGGINCGFLRNSRFDSFSVFIRGWRSKEKRLQR